MTTIADSYRSQSWSQRVLRVWLGITFIYAGWNKASDATFFTKGSSHYIGTQLTGFAHGSPLRPFLDLAAHQAVAVGWLTLLTEMAIGIAILLNVASLPAAIAGGLLSLTLWLSSSWHVHPYFLASDPAYFIMWSAYAIALFQQRAQKKALPVIVARGSRNRVQAATPANVDRRAVVRIGMVGGLAIFGGVPDRAVQRAQQQTQRGQMFLSP
jgi:thiosulfate dehydrogenase [quinone] large subunit